MTLLTLIVKDAFELRLRLSELTVILTGNVTSETFFGLLLSKYLSDLYMKVLFMNWYFIGVWNVIFRFELLSM